MARKRNRQQRKASKLRSLNQLHLVGRRVVCYTGVPCQTSWVLLFHRWVYRGSTLVQPDADYKMRELLPRISSPDGTVLY